MFHDNTQCCELKQQRRVKTARDSSEGLIAKVGKTQVMKGVCHSII
jgi:hypothetical protein